MDPEARIRELLAAGDVRAAATEAMRAFGPKILGYLRAILRDEADAGEAFSVWAEHLWRGIGSFRGESSFRTWAFKVARDAALNVRRRRPARPPGAAPGVPDERQRTILDELRASLDPDEQTLLALRIDQLS